MSTPARPEAAEEPSAGTRRNATMGGSKHWRFAAARNRADVDANGADGALDAKERALAEKRFDATRQRADAMAPFSGMLLTSRKHRTSTLGRSCTSEPKAKPIVLKMSRSRSSCYSTPPQGKTGAGAETKNTRMSQPESSSPKNSALIHRNAVCAA